MQQQAGHAHTALFISLLVLDEMKGGQDLVLVAWCHLVRNAKRLREFCVNLRFRVEFRAQPLELVGR